MARGGGRRGRGRGRGRGGGERKRIRKRNRKPGVLSLPLCSYTLNTFHFL